MYHYTIIAKVGSYKGVSELPEHLVKKASSFRSCAESIPYYDAIFSFFEEGSEENTEYYVGIRGVSKIPMCEFFRFEDHLKNTFKEWGYLAYKVEGCHIQTVTAGNMDLTPFVATTLRTDVWG